MDSPEPTQDEELRIANLIERAVEKVRQEFLGQLEEIHAQVERLVGGEAETAAPAVEEVLATPVTRGAGGASLESLHGAIFAIDRSRTQSQILSALLKGGIRFASRAVLLLTREQGLQGWAASGFGGAGEKAGSLMLPYDEETPWARLANGRGCVELSASECAELCGHIDTSRPAGGLLIPMVLRDQIAACLYVDRLAEDNLLDRAALQILTFVTGQAIEALPLRDRRSTATLHLATEVPAEEAGLPILGVAVAEPAVEEELPVEEVSAEAPPKEVPEEAPGVPSVETPEPVEPEPLEPVQESGFAVEPAEEVEAVEEPMPTEVEEVAEFPPPPAEEPSELPVEPEPIAIAPDEHVPSEPPTAPEPPAMSEEPAAEEPSAFETRVMTPEEASAAAEEVSTETKPPTPEPITPAPPAVPASSGVEIAPPDDLQGPGWAFTSTLPSQGEAGDQSQSEEARRLARLLVTEIKLYNEEQVEEGRRKGNIYQELRQDIERSRQIFDERIDDEVRRETDFFHEELVRILADGDSDVLGH